MAPKKLGLLTYHSNFNMGTFFQAYAALSSLRHTLPGVQVQLLNYESQHKHAQQDYHGLALRRRHVYPPYLIRHLRRRAGYRQAQTEKLGIEASPVCISDSRQIATDYLCGLGFDGFVVGSDTILQLYPWDYAEDQVPIFWLPPQLPGCKVMLAASVGTEMDVRRLSQKQRRSMADSARSFDLLGLRDEVSSDFLGALTPVDVELVPDPTLWLSVDTRPAKKYFLAKSIRANKGLIGLDVPASVPGLAEAVFALKQAGYCFVSWRGGAGLADYDLSSMTPFEWAGMFSQLRATLTNRFHASIFSLKNHCPVISVDVQERRVDSQGRSKCSMLLQSLGLRQAWYFKALDAPEPEALLGVLQAALADPRREQIEAGLRAQKVRYDDYLQKIRHLVSP